jgi:hypothetical protein
MNGEKILDHFILNYDGFVDKHINSISDLYHLVIVRDRNCHFIFY